MLIQKCALSLAGSFVALFAVQVVHDTTQASDIQFEKDTSVMPVPTSTPAPIPTPVQMPRPGELKCEVAMQRLLKASGYGASLSSLGANVKTQSFKVADVKSGMQIATKAIAKLPAATPEEQARIDKAMRLHEPLAALEIEYDAATSQIEAISRERRKIEDLVYQDRDLSVTRIEVERKMASAISKQRKIEVELNQKQAEFDATLARLDLDLVRTADQVKFVAKANFKNAMLAAVNQGEFAEAAKRIEYIQKTIGRAGVPLPFDEIVVVRGLSLDERKKISDEFRELVPEVEELGRLEVYRKELQELLQSKGRSTASEIEIKRLIERTEKRIAKLEEKNPRKVVDRLRAQLEYERPITVLKNNGVVVGAISDGQIQSTKLDPVTYKSRGFYCGGTSEVMGGWDHMLGMMSLEMCGRESKSVFYQEDLCRDSMNFHYLGRNTPVPTRSPKEQPKTSR